MLGIVTVPSTTKENETRRSKHSVDTGQQNNVSPGQHCDNVLQYTEL